MIFWVIPAPLPESAMTGFQGHLVLAGLQR